MLIYSKDKEALLMIQRTGAHGEGTWSVPGGWQGPGEDPREAAVRETWEEVGITVERCMFVTYSHTVFTEGLESTTLWFEATEWEGKPRNAYPDRIAAVRWCEQLPTPLFQGFTDVLKKNLILRMAG